jgi:hypothetical protein
VERVESALILEVLFLAGELARRIFEVRRSQEGASPTAQK